MPAAFAVLARLKVLDLGQAQGQLTLGQGHPAALVAIDHGDRLAPVALAAEHPVAQLEVDLLVALAVLLEPGVHLVLGILNGQAVQEVGVDERAGGHVGEGLLVEVAGTVPLTTSMMGRPNFLANSQSRVSWAGTAMMAPVP